MNKEEAIALLRRDVARFSEVRKADLEPLDLSGSDLARAGLKGADLRRINWSRASFREADLSEAEFSGCTLMETEFAGANLQGANFHHADMRGADLRGARFTPLTPKGRICLNPNSFDGTRWDKGHLEQILSVLNQNRDWEIQYRIVPKRNKD